MSSSPTSAPCRAPKRGRLLLVGGFTVPVIVLGTLLGATPANADVSAVSVSSKSGLSSAFGTAHNGDQTFVSVTEPLTGNDDDHDVLVVRSGTAFTLQLNGNEVDLDQIVLEDGASLTVQDGYRDTVPILLPFPNPSSNPSSDRTESSTSNSISRSNGSTSGPGLEVGTSASQPADTTAAATGVQLESDAAFQVDGARVTAVGSEGNAGIGASADASDTSVAIVDGSIVDATGGAGGAGIGGARASAASQVTVSNATVNATGGAGGAGIGGGYLGTTPSSTTIQSGSDVTVINGPLIADSPNGAVLASALGHGQDPLRTGPIGVVSVSESTVHIPTGASLDVPEGGQLDVDYDATVEVTGALGGAGSVSNDGTIARAGSGSIADGLDVTGNDYLVSFDANGGSTTAPQSLHVYARTMQEGGYRLSQETGSSAEQRLVGWTNTVYDDEFYYDYYGQGYVDQFPLINAATGPEKAVTFTARFERPIAFGATAMSKATLGTKFEQKLPVTGDAKWFYVSSYYDGDESDGGLESLSRESIIGSDDTLNGLPQGLRVKYDTGVISGYPSQPGHYTFTAYAYSRFQFKTQTITIDVAGAPVFATSDLPAGTAGSAYSAPIVATGDGATGSTTYAISGGTLPAGMTLSSSGVLTGTPSSAGSYSFGVKATNDYGSTKTAFSLEVAAGAVVPVAAAAPAASAAPAAAPAPVLPVVAPAEVKLGHQFQLSVAANSTEAVTYSIPEGELPKGLSFDAKTGLITGVPQNAGHFIVHVTAKTASGSTLRAYSIDVPEPTERITGNISRVTPKSGQAVKVAIRGLKVGERWTVFVDGKPAQTGKAKFGGSVFRTVHLATSNKDTAHVITVAGAQTSSDPSVLSSARLHLTTVSAKKTLKVVRTGSTFSVTGLAAQEKVTVKQGHKRLASGRADANGVFAFERSALKAGKHTLKVSGSTATRAGVLTFTVKK